MAIERPPVSGPLPTELAAWYPQPAITATASSTSNCICLRTWRTTCTSRPLRNNDVDQLARNVDDLAHCLSFKVSLHPVVAKGRLAHLFLGRRGRHRQPAAQLAVYLD